MNDDTIRELLHQADDRYRADSLDPARLTTRVRELARRAHRRRAIQTAISAGALIVLVAVGILLVSLHRPTSKKIAGQPAAGVDKATTLSELAKLNQEIKAEEQGIDQLVLAERLQNAQARLAAILPRPDADPVERAAAAVVKQGDSLREAGLMGEAATSYGQVVSYFPKTISAQTAHVRLTRMNSRG